MSASAPMLPKSLWEQWVQLFVVCWKLPFTNLPSEESLSKRAPWLLSSESFLLSCKGIPSETISEPAFLKDFQVILVPSLVWETQSYSLQTQVQKSYSCFFFSNFYSCCLFKLHFALLLSLPSAIQINTQHVSGWICLIRPDHQLTLLVIEFQTKQSSLAFVEWPFSTWFHFRCKFLKHCYF